MKILIACEYSGIVRNAFAIAGHDATSCDLLDTEISGKHYKGNVLDIINDGWDMMIAFPPCTHLAVSGARWFNRKQKEQGEALQFVKTLLNAPIDKIAIENPIGIISSKIKKPDQIVQPFWFGDAYKKSTCLWLKNLPRLVPTKMVEPEFVLYNSKKTKSGKSKYSYFGKFGKGFGHQRSKTPKGLAEAMALQWS
jgi:hypothetical protein